MLNKIHNALLLTETTYKKLEVFSYTSRTKRGLINGVGQISKWLFGTLDYDDEQNINSYLELLQSNDNKIHDELKQQQTLLKEMTKVYSDNFHKLNENQNILQNQLNQLSNELGELTNIREAFSSSNIIDNIILQLYSLQNLITNLETAISFARLNILHTSIIDPNRLKGIISRLNTIYKNRQIPVLKQFINYYSLFSTQLIIKDKIVIFKIHSPIVTSNPYKYLQMYAVPISNISIIPEHPFLILNAEDYWTTDEECPEIEDYFYCKKYELHKNQPCLAKLIHTGRNECPGTPVHFTETSAVQINAKEVLIIPAKSICIKSKCETDGIYEIRNPSTITIDDCKIDIEGKMFQTEDTLHEEFVYDLPTIEFKTLIRENPNQKILTLKKIDHENLRKIQTLADTLQTATMTPRNSTHSWSNTLILIIAIIGAICTLLYFRLYKRRSTFCQRISTTTPTSMRDQPTSQKITEPLFSALGREELCS